MLIRRIAEIFGARPGRPPAIEKIAASPVLMAEVLVLFRVVLADGMVRESELDAFQRICEGHFGIAPEDMPALHDLLETDAGRNAEAHAISHLQALDYEERTLLLDEMMQIARSDAEVHRRERRLIERMSRLLGLVGHTGKETGHD